MLIRELLTENEKYVHTGKHVDGSWSHLFNTADEALEDMAKYVKDRPLKVGIKYVDDNGGTHIVSAAPNSVRSGDEIEKIRQAYDDREYGLATPAQLKLLAKFGY